ncbi:MAG TPA: hypothetical protein VII49_06205, partial [Rhizomicrobium sp.]
RTVASAPAITDASTFGKGGAIVKDYAGQNAKYVELLGAAAQNNWPDVLSVARAADTLQAKLDAESEANLYRPTQIWPLLALAEAKTGELAAARALIDRTPSDCGLCIRARARIRATEGDWNASAFWFALAVKQEPSIPFAYADWGTMLMAKGDLDGAIEKFREANLKGPHFADPLEMWGEALMAKNRSDLALAKFEDADKYAPNWGRLHLQWGEALYWSGDKAGAQKQFDVASGLDLTPPEISELARMRGTHG